jgi:hypothetical protein
MSPEEEAILRELRRAVDAESEDEAIEILKPLQARVNKIRKLSIEFCEAVAGLMHLALHSDRWPSERVLAAWPRIFRPGHPEFDEMRFWLEMTRGRGFWRKYYREDDA